MMFIDIDATGAFFTLRETYEHVTYTQGSRSVEVRSFHHFNLSQDPDEALAKAQAFAAEYGMRLTSSRDDLTALMRDIKRATADIHVEQYTNL